MEPNKYLTPKKFLQCCGMDKANCNEMTIGFYLGDAFLNIQIYKEGSNFETYFISQIEDSGARFFMQPSGKGRRSVSLDKSEDVYKGLTSEILQSVVESIERRMNNAALHHPDFDSVFKKVREENLLMDQEAEAHLQAAENRKDSVRFMILLMAAIFQDYYSVTGISRRVKAYLEESSRYREVVPDVLRVRENCSSEITPISDLRTNRTYVRRGDLLDEAEKKLSRLERLGEKRFLLFYGAAGNGKSELARAYAMEYAGRRYSRQFWLTCPHGEEQLSLTSLCRMSLGGYGGRELLSILTEASEDVLLVIDNCNVEINALINELYYHTGNATVLVTSRLSSLSGFDERNALRVFSDRQEEFCLEIFRKNYEKMQMTGMLELSEEEETTAIEICRKVHLNPLFISMIASFLREHNTQISMEAFNRKLQNGLLEAFPKYSQLDFRKDDPEPVRLEPLEVLKVILREELNCIRYFAEEERQVMHLMLLFPSEPLSMSLISEILGDSEEQYLMGTVIQRLLDISLLQREENRIMIHPLVCELILSGIRMNNGVPILYEEEVKDAFYSHVLKNILLFRQKRIKEYMHLVYEIFSAIRRPDPYLRLVFHAYYDRKACIEDIQEIFEQQTDPSVVLCWDTKLGREYVYWNFSTKEKQILLDLSDRRKCGRYFKAENEDSPKANASYSIGSLLSSSSNPGSSEDTDTEVELLVFYEGRAEIPKPVLLDFSEGIDGHAITSIPNLFMRNTNRHFMVRFPEGLKRIGDWAFDNSRGFVGKLELPDSLEQIGKGAFHRCMALTGDLKLPEGLKILDDLAFCFCSGLTGELVLPEGLEKIGTMAFCLCRGFQGYVECPDSLKHVGDRIFYNSRLEPSEKFLHLLKEEKRMAKKTSQNLYISPFADTIENEAFYGRTDLAGEIKLPASIRSIGDQAFYQCSRIKGSLKFSSSLKHIGLGAFFACASLRGGLDLPDSLDEIGEGAFFGCTGLDGTLRLPRGLRRLSNGCFFMCSSLNALSNMEELTELKEIGEASFFGCAGLKGKLYLPVNLEKIGVGAFDGCKKITELCFPKSGKLRVLGKGSFGYCSGLRGTLHIPLGVEVVGAGCFTGCGYTTCVVHNRNCELEQHFLDESVEVVGYEGSTAQAYAEKFGNPFRILE